MSFCVQCHYFASLWRRYFIAAIFLQFYDGTLLFKVHQNTKRLFFLTRALVFLEGVELEKNELLLEKIELTHLRKHSGSYYKMEHLIISSAF